MVQHNHHKNLAPLQTSWHNRSLSSLNSDAPTFHSAVANALDLELTTSKQISPPYNIAVHKMEVTRQDSGFGMSEEKTVSSKEHRRSSSSTSSTRRRHSSKHPSSKRASHHSASAQRPSMSRNTSFQSRHNMNPLSTTSPSRASLLQQHQQQCQFFQFASLISPPSDPSSPIDPTSSKTFLSSAVEIEPEPVFQPPPATVHYWTSDNTRRMEYAAIDAASSGLRGFIYKLIPDCFLPESKRRPRFHEEGDDEDSDAGSVRRYRLALPEEKEDECPLQDEVKNDRGNGMKKRPGRGSKRH